MHGHGILTLNNGAMCYIGDFEYDKMCGEGTIMTHVLKQNKEMKEKVNKASGASASGAGAGASASGVGVDASSMGIGVGVGVGASAWASDSSMFKDTSRPSTSSSSSGSSGNNSNSNSNSNNTSSGSTLNSTKITYAYKGAWRNNEKNGEGEITFKSGNTYNGLFKDDKRVIL